MGISLEFSFCSLMVLKFRTQVCNFHVQARAGALRARSHELQVATRILTPLTRPRRMGSDMLATLRELGRAPATYWGLRVQGAHVVVCS